MTYISSVGIGVPPHRIPQQDVKHIVKQLFSYSEKQIERLLPVFDHAAVEERQFVVDSSWFFDDHSFEERNHIYQTESIKHCLDAIDTCLSDSDFLHQPIPYEAVDMIVFVSSTGIATPSLDVSCINERPFRENIQRMPLWGLGCAGGAIGLSNAMDWSKAHPDKIALIVCCELCSLTFQKQDSKKSNMVGTALFGDGASALLLMGENSQYCNHLKGTKLQLHEQSSLLKKHSEDIMGWNVRDTGFEVIFKKSIPALVHSFWKKHIAEFLQTIQYTSEDIQSFIAHPGGRKVMEAMEEVVPCTSEKLHYSYEVLKKHGNMSSVTVFYVIREWMKKGIEEGERSIISALGPGFSSELLFAEWKNV
ncbi:type III polyketide synthase [Oceanobacillus kimchii]|uniref:Chalcone synthase n=1 Tax=Oceanobacillus kimchii TaxID=746691 RepID=A0ABQ5TL91_9BACI|nr:3-oxoacyl-[acyl-carrier-protein] synthase III C-terminal domain-containing protein [Oceanobacillus kimchii]MCT1576077.1 type III polyketide synthase [Oceanobacillus kimchii]MCT2135714.1 type III polyketide synthase [Oceanobacillus kimchii]GLO66403.1 putative chalcone synthase [Oceanobacillus kimchii]